MTHDAMRRLRASNPIPELPPLTPIAVVMPGWEGMDGRDDAVLVGELPVRRSSKRWTRAGSVLIPAVSFTVAVLIVVLAHTAIHPAQRSAPSVASGHGGTYSNPEGWSVSHPAGFTLRLSRIRHAGDPFELHAGSNAAGSTSEGGIGVAYHDAVHDAAGPDRAFPVGRCRAHPSSVWGAQTLEG